MTIPDRPRDAAVTRLDERRASLVSTAVFVVLAAAGLFSELARLAVAGFSVALFLGGAVMMAAALVIAVQRSRESHIGVGDIFFTGPKPMLVALGVQVVVALISAGAHPNTGAAFAVLAPIGALGLCGLWGARHGQFPPRETACGSPIADE